MSIPRYSSQTACIKAIRKAGKEHDQLYHLIVNDDSLLVKHHCQISFKPSRRLIHRWMIAYYRDLPFYRKLRKKRQWVALPQRVGKNLYYVLPVQYSLDELFTHVEPMKGH